MKIIKTIVLALTLGCSTGLWAEDVQKDSTQLISLDQEPTCTAETETPEKKEAQEAKEALPCDGKGNQTATMTETQMKGGKFFRNRIVQSTYMGLPLVAAGLIEMSENKHFRTLRNDFVDKDYKHEFESYTQYAPAAVLLAMKALGVKGQSSWGKLMTAAAASALLEFGVAYGTKMIVNEERPDGASKSFPSGHTATSFMTATLLAKEYGHISPWIPIGGYTVATGSGIMRMVNNRHWMSDILAGAGIGIMSAEFGYWIADAIFPKTQKSYDPESVLLSDPENNPSFLGVYAGFVTPMKNHTVNGLRSHTGATMGLEGAYFLNNHWGIGGQAGVSDIYYTENGVKDPVAATVHFYTTQVGAYFSQQIYQRLFFGAKAIGGGAFYPTQNETVVTNTRKAGFCATTGVSLGFRAKEHCDLHIGCDYGFIPALEKGNSAYNTIILTGGAAIRF